MKHLWLTLLCFFGSLAALAQVVPPQRSADEGYIWWNYAIDNSGNGLTLSFPKLSTYDESLKAYSAQKKYNLCSIIPSKFAGCTITKVKIALAPPKVKYADDYIRLWLSPVKTHTSASGEVEYDIPASSAQAENVTKYATARTNGVYFQFYTITLKEPYVVPKGGCYVGYEFEVESEEDAFFLWGASEEGGCYLQLQEADGTSSWRNLSPLGIGNLTTSVYMELSDLVVTDATVKAQDERNYRKGETFSYAWTVTNKSSVPISPLDLAITIDRQRDAEENVSLGGSLPVDGSCTISRTLSFNEIGEHILALEVTKVDGRKNESLYPQAEGNILVIEREKLYPSTPVVEEFTSTSCSWCPRGTVGLNLLKQKYGDGIITLAGHTNLSASDPMRCPEYAEVIGLYGQSLPSAAFNRVALSDPYLGDSGIDANGQMHFAADKFVEKIRTDYPGEGKVTLTAAWDDAAMTTIRVKATSTFSLSRKNSPYRLAFLLAEDGMTGTNGDGGVWSQYNGYSYQQGDKSGTYPDDDMAEWLAAPSLVTTSYDHVVVAAWEPLRGIEGSVPAPIAEATPIDYETTLDISANKLIQDKQALSCVVLLLNDNNGFIVNAAQCSIAPSNPDGIVAPVAAAPAASAVYTLTGQRIPAMQKGLNIVRSADGRCQKVFLR